MQAIAYRKAEVEQVVAASRKLLAAHAPATDPNDHQLRALIAPGVAPPLGSSRPLVATATTQLLRETTTLRVVPLVGGVFPGRGEQLGATLALSLTPDRGTAGRGLHGELRAVFQPPLAGMPAVTFGFRLDGDRATPLPPARAAGCDCRGPGGVGDLLRCLADQAASALMPALTAGLAGLSTGPEGFLVAAGAAAAAQLPQAVTGAIGCFDASPAAARAAGTGELTMLSYPVAEAQRVLHADAGLAALLADGAQPLDGARWNDLVCTGDDGLMHLTGLLAQTPTGAVEARGRLGGRVSTVPAEWQFSVEATDTLVTVSVESLQPPRFDRAFRISANGPPAPSRPAPARTAGGFDLACLIAAARGPLLSLTAACLPRLRDDGVRPFLRAMLDGAGEALGEAAGGVVRRCVAGRARATAETGPLTDPGGMRCAKIATTSRSTTAAVLARRRSCSSRTATANACACRSG